MFQHKVDQAKPIMFQQDIDQGYIKHGEMFHPAYDMLACENSRFSSLFVAGDVSRGGTSAT